jgi:DUF971 family protein
MIAGHVKEFATMSGLDRKTPTPTEITLHKKSRLLEVKFDDGSHYRLPAEFLRVCSPSAEVRGHGPGQETLQTGKRNVEIIALEPVGNSGIYSWDWLHGLGANQQALWAEYLERLEKAGGSRDVDSTTLPPKATSCASR